MISLEGNGMGECEEEQEGGRQSVRRQLHALSVLTRCSVQATLVRVGRAGNQRGVGAHCPEVAASRPAHPPETGSRSEARPDRSPGLGDDSPVHSPATAHLLRLAIPQSAINGTQ
ncbi:hypothetical protein CALCODRAFT_37136 [Calocera cornea HHB12733]|uniref:Uncharacterized protein n=1 Tax=Calocera cornea HHB12733 TaxID=1353952 RepID=A0A165DZU2_9BASI|nr:hypothetical protein CALCODRAFT_37136 [Calocera cornea HHB12733]